PAIVSIDFTYTATAAAAISTLSLHDALPISRLTVRSIGGCSCSCRCAGALRRSAFTRQDGACPRFHVGHNDEDTHTGVLHHFHGDRKSTRLNSSHVKISYAVFCLKKKQINNN